MGIEINKNAIVNVSADRLWSILADDFDTIGEWASGIDSSGPNTDAAVPEGASVGGRVCQVPSFGAINERFTSFDPVERSFSFEATASKLPSFVRNLTNHTSVKSLGSERSDVQIRSTADTLGVQGAEVEPALTAQFSQAIDGVLEDLKIFAESGKVSSRKTKELADARRCDLRADCFATPGQPSLAIPACKSSRFMTDTSSTDVFAFCMNGSVTARSLPGYLNLQI